MGEGKSGANYVNELTFCFLFFLRAGGWVIYSVSTEINPMKFVGYFSKVAQIYCGCRPVRGVTAPFFQKFTNL